jgi:hypothetical protein
VGINRDLRAVTRREYKVEVQTPEISVGALCHNLSADLANPEVFRSLPQDPVQEIVSSRFFPL